MGGLHALVIREHSSGSACSDMALYYTQNYIQNLDEGLAFANKLIDFCLDTVCFLVFWLFSTFCTICLAIVLVKRPFNTECCGDFFGFKHIY